MTKTFLFLAALLAGARAETPCERTEGAVFNHERVLLDAAAHQRVEAMARPLACLLDTQEHGEGRARLYAASVLRPLLGGSQLAGVMADRRYAQASRLIERMTAHAADPVADSVVSRYAGGDWTFYKLFCEEGNTDYCVAFLPDERKVRAESPLLAAAGILRLRKAYGVLRGPQREEVGQRIKTLYRDIPREDGLRRKFIDLVYEELFGRKLSVS